MEIVQDKRTGNNVGVLSGFSSSNNEGTAISIAAFRSLAGVPTGFIQLWAISLDVPVLTAVETTLVVLMVLVGGGGSSSRSSTNIHHTVLCFMASTATSFTFDPVARAGVVEVAFVTSWELATVTTRSLTRHINVG